MSIKNYKNDYKKNSNMSAAYFKQCEHIIDSYPQTLIFLSLYRCNPMSETLDISNYEFCKIK